MDGMHLYWERAVFRGAGRQPRFLGERATGDRHESEDQGSEHLVQRPAHEPDLDPSPRPGLRRHRGGGALEATHPGGARGGVHHGAGWRGAARGPATSGRGAVRAVGAAEEPIRFYRELEQAAAFRAPRAWGGLDVAEFDALLLPGGHAPGMRQYLGNSALQERVAAFWKLGRPVAAICHGVLLAARSKDPATGASFLRGARTTCLPKY